MRKRLFNIQENEKEFQDIEDIKIIEVNESK